jgi:primase-like protein/bifunctional DNA primase/polymerase-like protein
VNALAHATAVRHKLAAAGFAPIPVQGKIPAPPKWQRLHDVGSETIGLWPKVFPHAPNTGLLTRTTPTIDIDIAHPEAAIAVEEMVRGRLDGRGPVLVRFGRAPRRAIPLRTDQPFKKVYVEFDQPRTADDKKQRVEILGDGQQFVALGIHPDTDQPYRWFGGEPGDVRRDELPPTTELEAREILVEAEKILLEFGFTGPKRSWGVRASKPAQDAAPRPAIPGDADRIQSALAFISSDDREVWIDVGMALHSLDPGNGREMWRQWSASSSKYDPDEIDYIWDSFGRRSGTTIATLFHYATKAGWDVERRAWSAAGYFLARYGPPSRAWAIFKGWCQSRPVPPIGERWAQDIFEAVLQKDLSR